MHQNAPHVPQSSRPVKVSALDLDLLKERNGLHWRGNTMYAWFDGVVRPLDVIPCFSRRRRR
jgi:hypothetical protein